MDRARDVEVVPEETFSGTPSRDRPQLANTGPKPHLGGKGRGRI